MSLKTHLSHLMPVAQAVSIIGEEIVTRMVTSLLKSQNPKSSAQDIDSEASTLVASMLYTSHSGHKGPSTTPHASDIPPPIRNAWRQLQSRPLLLSKTSLIRFLVPPCCQPQAGTGGHMGLFDCLVYALQAKPNPLLPSGGEPMGANSVNIPDIVIFLAVCQNYSQLQNETDESVDIGNISSDHPAIVTMSQWMFLVYDAYQKKGLVVRDTIHRFLSDIHGEESFKTPAVRELLNQFFRYSPQLTAREFVKAIADTLVFSPQPSHLLLDWMAGLAHAIQPRLPPSESTEVFLQTIDRQSRGLPQILDQYALAEYRLYETKRRFHSLVETTSTIIQGDPMIGEGATVDGSPASGSKSGTKHVITRSVFCLAVCNSSSDQGHGGYLPHSLAGRVFDGMVHSIDEAKETPKAFWDLTHVLTFGCMCVRAPDDEVLIKWILERMLPSSDSLVGTRSKPEMTAKHVGELLQLVCEHMTFRLQADKPCMEDTENVEGENGSLSGGVFVNAEAAMSLGLLPDNPPTTTTVPLQLLVDSMMKHTGSGNTVSLEQLVSWQREGNESEKRLGAFLMELRLISSVLFGVPPKRASLEHKLVEEIHKRHKTKYPQTLVSRRGPQGTIWYIIDDRWYRSWNSMVEKVRSTPEDDQDLRDKDSDEANPRRLDRISNRGLLRDGGSLALRVDIKWRNDYEIVAPLAWSALQAWYDGGPPIYRSVVPYAASKATSPHSRAGRPQMRTENELELYPFFVTMFLCDTASRGEPRPFQQGVPVSRVSHVRVLLVQLCKGLGVDPDRGRLWVMESVPSPEGADERRGEDDWLLELDTNVAEQRKNRLENDQSSNIQLLLELKDPELRIWPRGEDGRTWSFSKKDNQTLDTGDGIVGLYNMGNTCYMNASIQCLSHTPIFRDYFTSNIYVKDINASNPLGYQGRLAHVSAVLIKSLWKRFNQQPPHQVKRVTAPGTYAPVNAPSLTPKTFKDSLGKFNDIFAGNEQHDAQELLAFLLGGLSEDLNRILEKPYIQAPDSDGRPDRELADIWWSNHLKREVSIIVALFTGQYKSLLKCKSCGYESARFEPYTFLQVPLPEDNTVPVTLILYPVKPGKESMKYCVRVQSNGTLYDVLLALSKILHSDNEASTETPDTEEDKEQLREIYAQKAKNLAVVDMRDGYIFKIAPNAWRLPDLQNKDTGELPVLHVYELDPITPEVPEDGSNGGSDKGGNDEIHTGVGFLALAQRKTETTADQVLHPLTHRVFGTPLLLRIPNMEALTGKQIYDLVAMRLRNFVPPGALQFLAPSKMVDKEERSDGSNQNVAGLTKLEIRQRLSKTLTDSEEVAAGPVPRYGFRLRLTTRDGRRCAIYPWYDCSIGCLVPDDNAPTVVMNGDSLVIDWHFVVDVATNGFGTRGKHDEKLAQHASQRLRPQFSVKNHSSCEVGKKYGQSGSITLEDCLDAFAKEEKIPETYCSKCKDFRVQTKRMSLWRLPPVVIIHLKRFQFTQHMRRKLRDFVDFPMEGLDLSRIMAVDNIESIGAGDEEIKNPGDSDGKGDASTANGGPSNAEESTEPLNQAEESAAPLNQDDGRSEMLYDLYGVVHHQGALSGGHYVASVKSDDGQWRLFNDAQVYEIHSRDVVDSSAYILFYIRRDVKKLTLEDFWNTSPGGGEGLTEEQMDKLIRDRSERCVIS